MIPSAVQLRAVALAAVALLGARAQAVPPSAGDRIAGDWRIVDGRPGPWAAPGEATPPARLTGQRVVFNRGRIVRGGALACAAVHYQAVDLPAEGLFQGGLPAPAAASAAQLGIAHLPVPSVRVDCDGGSFDYHLVRDDTLLVALDNMVWRLVFQPRSARAAAEGFLRAHFDGDMAFTPQALARKRRWLSPALRAASDHYFAQPRSPDEVPVINGDPFTDTQEYPGGFAVTSVRETRHGARVRITYRAPARRLEFLLVRGSEEGWRIDDVIYRDGTGLRSALASPAR